MVALKLEHRSIMDLGNAQEAGALRALLPVILCQVESYNLKSVLFLLTKGLM
jgi:hypothetical protein